MSAAPQPAAAPKPRKSWAGLLVLVVLGYLASCSAIQFGLHKVFVKRRPVEGMTPAHFPVVVVTVGEDGKPHAQIVLQEALGSFAAEHLNYSFLIPPGEEGHMREAMEKNSIVGSGHYDLQPTPERPWDASFQVQRLANGRQGFEVHYDPYDDLSYKSWYEATDKEIFPQYHYEYAEIGGMFTTGAAIFLTTILWVAGFILFLAYRVFKSWGATTTGATGRLV